MGMNGNGHHTNGNGRGHTNGHGRAMSFERMMTAIQALKRERGAIILAHNYQDDLIQRAADVLGDSLKLAKAAQQTDAKVIVFCGVHFMAETAAMLNPEKMVLMPDAAAGCSLADMILPNQIRQWRQEHPGGVVVGYVNTSAAVKAECDVCCTSANGEHVIAGIPADREILFVPDFYLGTYLKAKTRRNIHVWKGYCPSHAVINPEEIDQLRACHPDAEFLMHPECGCLTKQMDLADKILSTDGMVRYAGESAAREFIIATDRGILSRLRREHPAKTFYAASDHAACHHMQQNTLEKVLRSLVTLEYRVAVDPAVAQRAVIPLQRMMELSK